jgi:hypothetical protein
MKIIVFSKRDIITHPLAISLLTNWSKEGHVEYFTIHTELSINNCKINCSTGKKYLDHKKMKRYFLTIVFYFKMLVKFFSYKNEKIYFPFSNGKVIDNLIKYFKGKNLIIFHSFEYNESNLRGAKFADIVIHPETTRLKLTSFKIPNKEHFYFPNVNGEIKSPAVYANVEDLNKFSNGRIKLLYQGLISIEKRCLREILEALKEIENTVCLIIMPAPFTDPKEMKMLKNIIEKLKLDNAVLFVPSIKSPNHLGIIEYIDIGIGLYKPTSINQYFAAPNRLYEINQFKKPLILPDNVGLKLFEYEFKGEVFCCDPHSKSSIVKAIQNASKLKSGTKQLSFETGDFSYYFKKLNRLIRKFDPKLDK